LSNPGILRIRSENQLLYVRRYSGTVSIRFAFCFSHAKAQSPQPMHRIAWWSSVFSYCPPVYRTSPARRLLLQSRRGHGAYGRGWHAALTGSNGLWFWPVLAASWFAQLGYDGWIQA